MIALLAILSVILIAIVAVQIGKVSELATKIRGEEEVQLSINNREGTYLLVFMVLLLIFSFGSFFLYKNYMLGYGPLKAASAHGPSLDRLFHTTLFFTGIVFVLTQIALFYFAYKYRARRGSKAVFISHNNKLEIVWTIIPAIVMTFLVIGGLDVWNEVMADVKEDEEFIELEATGYQFGWALRYPGADGKLGEKNYQLISGTNPLGQDWTDRKNLDDFQPTEIVLPVNKQVRVRITSQDVLHNFYLPHFRVKMDAVPGMPTYFVFTPTITTDEYRRQLRDYDEYNVPIDPEDPEGPLLWEEFNFELACAELCGRGHYSMQKIVRIVSEEEYQTWASEQTPYYVANVRGTEDDPFTNELFGEELTQLKESVSSGIDNALAAGSTTLVGQYIRFATNSADLEAISRYELDIVTEALKENPNLQLEIGGHTDNTGAEEVNQTLSQQRAESVVGYLMDQGIDADRLSATGYGATQPVGDNATEEGRAKNRRTEFKITNKG